MLQLGEDQWTSTHTDELHVASQTSSFFVPRVPFGAGLSSRQEPMYSDTVVSHDSAKPCTVLAIDTSMSLDLSHAALAVISAPKTELLSHAHESSAAPAQRHGDDALVFPPLGNVPLGDVPTAPLGSYHNPIVLE